MTAPERTGDAAAEPARDVQLDDVRRGGWEHDQRTAAAIKKAWMSTIGRVPRDAPRAQDDAAWLEFRKQYEPPLRQEVRALAKQVAADVGADPHKLVQIIYSRGDLESLIPVLATIEESREADLRQVKAAHGILRTLIEHGWPFEDWPFETELPGGGAHPFSRAAVEKVVCEVITHLGSILDALEKLDQIRDERASLGIRQGPASPSFQKAPVFREIAFELYEELVTCCFRSKNPGSHGRTLQFSDVEGEIDRKERTSLLRNAIQLVDVAFPTYSRLTPARVRASTAATGAKGHVVVV